ncbi:phosphoenolpyruvate carboxylase [Kiloniella sp. b19]|uniref:phosphoenolpyruvate carboxylase n=1 Tax=Kiloniella sp. GXU_MW_B19 TaxID=3141326 RepID=UPI0031DA0E33
MKAQKQTEKATEANTTSATRMATATNPATMGALPVLNSTLVGSDRYARARELRDEMAERLIDLRQNMQERPLSNPVMEMAHDISERLHDGDLSAELLEQLVQVVSVEAIADRAERTMNYLGVREEADNRKALTELLETFAVAEDGKSVRPFEDFARKLERAAQGIVVTAHPTFGLSEKLYQAMAQLASNQTLDGEVLEQAKAEELSRFILESEHKPDASITLLDEHAQAQKALVSLQNSLRVVYDVALGVAAKHYPDQWTRLTPRLLTLASWVGYDLDGRTDITWANTLHTRLKVQVAQLKAYIDRVGGFQSVLSGDQQELKDLLALLRSRLVLALRVAERECDCFGGACSSSEELRETSRRIVEDENERLVDTSEILQQLDRAVALARKDDLVRQLLVFKAEIANYGLAVSHMHMRLNAAQLHNAIRKTIGMEGDPDDTGRSRTNVTRLNELLSTVKPVRINFGDLAAENTSAKRTFMLLAQMIKYVDSTQPIRFLIAECETPFTLLSALYYARLFGIEDLLDISPLFETGLALQRGAGIIGDLLKNEHYRAYVQKRGRLCIQTGFSDAGRYLGQVAASLAIERLHIKLAKLVHDEGLEGVEVVIFDTHGESMGRGAHPRSLEDRLKYLSSPQARSHYEELSVPLKHEISFQGGDGYLMFQTPKMALTTVTRLLCYAYGRQEKPNDPFYEDTSYSLDFFLTLKGFHENAMENRDYAALLSTFGTNLLYQTGSRKSKRQHERQHGVDVAHPSQIRAIPHNAILQQLGYMANTASGFGSAVSRDLDRFISLYRSSDRVRRLMDMVSFAKGFSSLNTPDAYAALFDPRHWLMKAYAVKGTERGDEFLRLSTHVAELENYEGIKRMLRIFREDAIRLHQVLDGLEADGQEAHFPFHARRRINLLILHVVRICLMQQMFLSSMRIPQFAVNNDFTKEDVVKDILALEIPAALEELRTTFPILDDVQLDQGDYGEPSDYHDESNRDYRIEHERIFAPLEEQYELCRRITVGISNCIGAHG